MTVNQARNAVRTGTGHTQREMRLLTLVSNNNGVVSSAAAHSQERPTAAVTPVQSATPVAYIPHLTVYPQPSSNAVLGCNRAGVALGCAAASLTPPNVSAASLEGDALRPMPVLTVPGNSSALNSAPNNAALSSRLDKDSKVGRTRLQMTQLKFSSIFSSNGMYGGREAEM